jgi:ribonucleoside-diphosphate reductase alpha chain
MERPNEWISYLPTEPEPERVIMTFSTFAQTIFEQKYAHDVVDGDTVRKETWTETVERVVREVVRPLMPESVADELEQVMIARKFLPGGRYLYASGRILKQVNNCALFSVEDSREGWADLMQRITNTLMTGAGIGVDYSKLRPEGSAIRGTGGTSTGPLALMQMVNEAGRHIMQGGR